MDICEALSRDHRIFEALLDALLEACRGGRPSWKVIADQLRRGLVAHARAEEAIFYNSLRALHATDGRVAGSYAEHAVAEGEIRTLEIGEALDVRLTPVVYKLSGDLRRHIADEEARSFAAARAVLNEHEAHGLGQAFVCMKQQLAGDSDSLLGSGIDLIANLLPPRLGVRFREMILPPAS